MVRSTFKILILVFGITLFFSSNVIAQSQDRNKERKEPPSFEKLLEDLDADEDGKISLKEVKGPLKKDFSKIDKDEDGFLTKEEIEKAPKPKGREQKER